MNCAERHAFIRSDNEEYLGFRFKEPFQAERMAQEFGGETYYALDRVRGSGWEKWRNDGHRASSLFPVNL
ncbi:hypothetical protein B5V01_34030 [Mesorhizobium erdmanii]|uniref:Uncharacterized protein n=2 Tax=Mesorhizobium TaxID=68287 RepID=A0A3M9XHV6_9HYPH|nr:hypothetical protein DNR46_03390 [Mesorhizobium japonicum]RXT34065.1 hypothetical protein B5V01_34030 [Mesorhizobium erdmanii]